MLQYFILYLKPNGILTCFFFFEATSRLTVTSVAIETATQSPRCPHGGDGRRRPPNGRAAPGQTQGRGGSGPLTDG